MKKKILLLALIVIILLCAGGTYAYFSTDAFKSNKNIFFSYLYDGLKDETLEKYIKKQENESYTNKGNVQIEANGENSELDEEKTQMLDNSKITFEGKVDNNKKLAEQTVTMNFESEGFNVPVKIRRDGDTIGIQSNLLNSKFIAIKNENLKALFEKLELDSEEIPDKIEVNKKVFTEDEIKTLKNRYNSILIENLENDLFSREKTADGQTVISLNVPEKKCSEILVKILETLREDDIILDKISDIIDKDEFKDNINDEIDEIKDIDSDEDSATLCIKMYIKSKDIKKIEISLNDSKDNKTAGQLEIIKEIDGKDLTYEVKINGKSELEEEFSMDIKIQYKNIKKLNDVEEIYEIKLKTKDDTDNLDMSINYTNLKTFTKNVEIEEINNDNAIIVNDASDDEINELLITVYEKLGLMDDEEDYSDDEYVDDDYNDDEYNDNEYSSDLF